MNRLRWMALLAGGLMGLQGCAGWPSKTTGIQASERFECQRAIPPRQQDCLNQAEQGTVIYTPHGMGHDPEQWKYSH